MNKLFIFLVIILAACTKSTDEQDFNSNRNKWEKKSITNYEFTLRTSCFCPPEIVGPHKIKVSNDQIVSVDDEVYNPAEGGYLMTIDGLFTFISKSQASHPYKQSIEYNSEYGYPESIYFDFYKTAVDEEKGYTITEFRID